MYEVIKSYRGVERGGSAVSNNRGNGDDNTACGTVWVSKRLSKLLHPGSAAFNSVLSYFVIHPARICYSAAAAVHVQTIDTVAHARTFICWLCRWSLGRDIYLPNNTKYFVIYSGWYNNITT